jgi:hypothetical protein
MVAPFLLGPLVAKYVPMVFTVGEAYGWPRLYRRFLEGVRRGGNDGQPVLEYSQRTALEKAVKDVLRAPTTAVNLASKNPDVIQILKKLDGSEKDSALSVILKTVASKTNSGKLISIFAKIIKDASKKSNIQM